MKRNTRNRKIEIDGRLEAKQLSKPEPILDEEEPILDEEDWLILIEPAFHDRPAVAETFARRLLTIKEAIESGEEDRRRIVEALDEGIRLTYRYTKTHQLAWRLFNLYLAGELLYWPEELLEEAIERSLVKDSPFRLNLPMRGGKQ
jgi:hypothetical protein